MDWIEHVFGIAPDGGTGLTEAVIIVSVLMAVVFAAVAVRWRDG